MYLGGNIIMKLTPLGDRVVLKQLEAETTTKSGSSLQQQHWKNHRKQKLLQLDLEQKM